MTQMIVQPDPANAPSPPDRLYSDSVHDGPPPVAAAPGSQLINIRAQRAKMLQKLHLDLEVPRIGDEGPAQVWIRYRPASFSVGMRAAERRRKQKLDEAEILAAADVLVEACVGVYVKVDGQAYTVTPDREWRPFDPDHAADTDWVSVRGERATDLAAVTVEGNIGGAVELMRALFATENDMLAHSIALGNFSTKEVGGADQELLGE